MTREQVLALVVLLVPLAAAVGYQVCGPNHMRPLFYQCVSGFFIYIGVGFFCLLIAALGGNE